MTQENFNETRHFRKGMIGEAIVRQRLEASGWQVTQFTYNSPHIFDMFCHKMNTGQSMAVEVKTKSRMKYYDETGISHRHFERYLKWIENHDMPFWIMFVDHCIGCVFAGDFRSLVFKPMSKRGDSVTWQMRHLTKWQDLTAEEVESIGTVSESYDVTPVYNSALHAQLELELRK